MTVPGSAHLVLAPGVVHLDEPSAVLEAMLSGWGRQQKSRLLADATIEPRLLLLRRFTTFADSHPWDWTASYDEDFTASLMSGTDRLATSTIRGYHLTLRLFCDYQLDGRYRLGRPVRTALRDDPVGGLPLLHHRRASG